VAANSNPAPTIRGTGAEAGRNGLAVGWGTRAAIMMRRADVELLHIIGATDLQIARHFERDALRQASLAAIGGSVVAALIVAGRSGSAFAAQIGTMLVTQEVDAMRTIGIDPHQMLVLPKFIALLVVVPLLTIYADVLGVAGGMVMAQPQLGVGYEEFLHRFPQTVSVTTLLTGLGKAPVFGAIVALVSCFQGFQAAGGADSVGRQTTRAVVATFFLVIVVDGLFSIAFSMLDL
jgi:ABC transport permease subunit